MLMALLFELEALAGENCALKVGTGFLEFQVKVKCRRLDSCCSPMFAPGIFLITFAA